jgi:uncharacterized protein (TIGR03435 family)
VKLVSFITLHAALCAFACAQTPGTNPEFEAVSIKPAAPQPFFHADSGTGGPGTSDPGMFHCTCTLAALIEKAFDLQRYQFPGESALPSGAFEISAKIPAGATREQFLLMLQGVLKDRFALAWHYETKEFQGYDLTIAKGGPKLKEASSEPRPAAGPAGSHEHTGVMNFNGRARYRTDRQTMAALAALISSQIAKPVEDRTGLTGAYDISLDWSAEPVPHNHVETSAGRAGGYGDHAAAPAASAAPSDDAGPSLFEALQSQLGLKLVASKKSPARVFVIEHIGKTPTAN